jgi:hypothetical protein
LHPRRITVVEGRHVFQRQASITEGHIEDTLGAGVHAAQRHLAPGPIGETAVQAAETASVKSVSWRRYHDDAQQ